MKTQKTKALHLKKGNARWKWMAGATAATAAGVTASQATTITVTLSNNYISDLVNQLNADLTGDGHADVTFKNTNQTAGYLARVSINGVVALGERLISTFGAANFARVGAASKGASFFTVASVTANIPITFTDAFINGGATTNGLLEVTASAGPGGEKVNLDSFSYNSTATVPDQGSTLALLAMGAGGVIALRQRRKAA